MQTKNIDETFDEYYGKIRESINGINEIIKINFLENNIYHKLSMDNLNALNENVIELLKDPSLNGRIYGSIKIRVFTSSCPHEIEGN